MYLPLNGHHYSEEKESFNADVMIPPHQCEVALQENKGKYKIENCWQVKKKTSFVEVSYVMKPRLQNKSILLTY
jgi:hypothetical protein